MRKPKKKEADNFCKCGKKILPQSKECRKCFLKRYKRNLGGNMHSHYYSKPAW